MDSLYELFLNSHIDKMREEQLTFGQCCSHANNIAYETDACHMYRVFFDTEFSLDIIREKIFADLICEFLGD